MPRMRLLPRAMLAAPVIAAVLYLATIVACQPAAAPSDPLVVGAGSNQTIAPGGSAVLQGTATGGVWPYGYAWSPATGLSSTTVSQPTFTPTQTGTFSFILTVTDAAGTVGSAPVTITVTAGGTGSGSGTGAPTGTGGTLSADAGADQPASIGFPFQIIGSAAGGSGSLTISWTGTGPGGGAVSLTSGDTVRPTFTPTAAGQYSFSLFVRDATGATANDTVLITASSGTTLSALTWGADYTAGGYKVIATFVRALDPTSAQIESNYRLTGTLASFPTLATLTESNTVELLFNGPFADGQTFDISVDSGVLDSTFQPVPQTSGRRALANALDSALPAISTVQWSPDFVGSYGVDVVFSEAMDAGTLRDGQAYRLKEGGVEVLGDRATLGADGKTVTVVFKGQAFSRNALIDVGLLGIQDINGKGLSPVQDRAIIANPADTTAPAIVEGSIQFGPDFAGGGYQVFLDFSEAMDKDRAETAASYTVDNTFAAVAAALGRNGRSLTLTFEGNASEGSLLDIAGSSVSDVNGQFLPAQNDLNILPQSATVAGPGVPTLTWLPGDQAEGYQMRARFNVAMDAASVEELTNWELAGTTINPASVMLAEATAGDDIAGRTAIITFDNIALTTTDRIVFSVGDSIMDVNGNAQVENTLFVSKDTRDTMGPHPEDEAGGAAKVFWGDVTAAAYNGTFYRVSVTFTETVDAASASRRENYRMVWFDTVTKTTVSELTFPSSVVVDPAGDLADIPPGRRVVLTFATTLDRPGTVAVDPGFQRLNPATLLEDRLRISTSVMDMNGRSNPRVAPQPIRSNAADAAAPTLTAGTWGLNQGPYRVVLAFSEVLDGATATNPENYLINTPAGTTDATAATLSSNGRVVTLTFEGPGAAFAPADQLFVDVTDVLDINGVAHAGGVAVNIAQDPVADDDAPFLTSIVWEPDPLDPLFPLVITQPRVRARFNEGLDRVNVPTVTLYNLGPSPNPTVTSIEPTAAVLQDGGTDIVVTFPLGGIPDAFGPVPLLAVARNELMTAFIGPTTPAGPPPAAGLFDMHGNPSTSVNPQRRQALTLARNPLDIVAVPLEPVVVMWDANYGLNAGDVPEGYGLTALFSAELLDRINAENAGNYRVTNTAVNPRVPVSPLLPFILESGVTLDVSGVALTDGIQVHLEFGPAVLAGLARPLRTERAFLGGVDTLEINGSGSITDLNANVFPTFSQVAIAPNGADAVAPTVVSVAQRLELTSGLTKVIEVTFNEAMDAASITADDFRDILDDDGNPAGTLIPPATQIDADSVQFGEPATAFTTALGSSTKVFVYYVGRDIAQGGAVGNGSVTIGLVADINGNTVTPGATAIP